jgi:hypothetical protein
MRVLAALLALSFLAVPALARQMEDEGVAVLRTIDKISARSSTFEVPVDKTIKFGDSLFIKVRACRKASALERPESAAFLQIWERKPKEVDSSWVFSGWMFASSPSVSAMDHPVYDVWVIDCKSGASPAKQAVFSTEAAPAAPAPETEAPPVHVSAPPASGQQEAPSAPAAAPEEKHVSPEELNAHPSFEGERSSEDGEDAVATPDDAPGPKPVKPAP